MIAAIGTVLSGVALLLLVLDRSERIEQGKPVLVWELSPPGLDDAYGFYIKNIGDRRARIERIVLGYNPGATAEDAGQVLSELAYRDGEYFRFVAGPGFTMEPRERQYLYIFNKPLSTEQIGTFYRYIEMLAADIYYCEIDLSACWTKTVSVQSSGPSVAVAHGDIPPETGTDRIVRGF